jgi:ubiquinone/menaquinone biosynthesis C-methylase UbiE
MTSVDYEKIAPAYDRRYALHPFGELEASIRRFVTGAVVEVGCGTGHWLASVAPVVARAIGVEPSAAMLAKARVTAPNAALLRATAEALPLANACADRVLCVNALHHFADRRRFVSEARRVLRPGGAVMIVGLDPHADEGAWWIYDAFPSARRLDRNRYPAASEIRGLLAAADFHDSATTVAQRIAETMSFDDAVATGHLDRRSTSQLMVIDDAEWDAGLACLRAARPVLRADLRLYATVAWVR